MSRELDRFILAHDRYLALVEARCDCDNARQREYMHIEIMEAYLEVQFRARHITAIQYADGNDYAELN